MNWMLWFDLETSNTAINESYDYTSICGKYVCGCFATAKSAIRSESPYAIAPFGYSRSESPTLQTTGLTSCAVVFSNNHAVRKVIDRGN
jgi:hypothetical protein